MRLRHPLGWKLLIGLALVLPAAFGVVAPAGVRAQAGQTPGAASEVTFSKDIAPILQRSCQNCHRPDGVAPMSLVTYDDVRPWARSIKVKTGLGPKAGVMPSTVARIIGSAKSRTAV